jgi:hypothetical protein
MCRNLVQRIHLVQPKMVETNPAKNRRKSAFAQKRNAGYGISITQKRNIVRSEETGLHCVSTDINIWHKSALSICLAFIHWQSNERLS